MTDPNVSVGNVTTGAPDVAYTTEMIQQSQRLGLVWQRRMGVITRVTTPGSQTTPMAILDGDTLEINITNMTGQSVAPGMRVFVDSTPPANNYAVAVASSLAPMVSMSTSSTDSITTETVVHTIANVMIFPSAAYRVRVGQSLIGATNSLSSFAIRLNDVTGTTLAVSPVFNGQGLIYANAQWVSYLAYRATTGPVTRTFALTFTSNVGAIFAAATTIPRFFELEYCGAAEDYPHACTIV